MVPISLNSFGMQTLHADIPYTLYRTVAWAEQALSVTGNSNVHQDQILPRHATHPCAVCIAVVLFVACFTFN
jgi:hypothetical protein